MCGGGGIAAKHAIKRKLDYFLKTLANVERFQVLSL